MAKKQRQPKSPNTSSIETNTFVKGMNKDFNPSYEPKQNWTHARNAANNSVDGDVGMLGNEPANLECGLIPYTVIGTIHLYADKWAILSTNDLDSEIGIFDDSECTYQTIVNDQCLNFNRKYLITGAAKENFDCTWQIYFDDSFNPSRTLNLDRVPYIQEQTSALGDPCIIMEDTPLLDCEKLRIAPLLDTPCIKITKAPDGGQLRNGTYQAFIAYTLNEQKVTDYIGISNIQSLFDHDGTAGALDIKVSNLDKEFEFFELVILSNNQNSYVAKRIGLYSTEISTIGLDYIDQSLPSVALEQLPFRSPAYEKSDSMFVVNDWLIRKGPTEQFDFNYQPIANQILAKWVIAEYPASYYYKGGNKTGFMRDEQYAFFIRWIYNTGERSKSYHIPGRAPKTSGFMANGIWQTGQSELTVNNSQNTLDPGAPEFNWQVYNTGAETGTLSDQLDDGGVIIAEGEMGYWESTEIYPPLQPEIWNATYTDPETNINIGNTNNTDYDLCGKPIRHHKMPSEETSSNVEISDGSGTVRILGVQFENIKPPLYNDGTIIENIVGYEILRGSREGNKSILAKGIFRNMRGYQIPSGGVGEGSNEGLYPNFPYNDLRGDMYHWNAGNQNNPKTDGCDEYDDSISGYAPLTTYKKDVFTFHSPELTFKRPFLNAYETRIYGELHGNSIGHFIKSENHPQNKLLRNSASIVAGLIGVGYAIQQMQGTRSINTIGPQLSALMPGTAPYFTIATAVGGGQAYPNPEYWGAVTGLGINGGVTVLVDTLVDILIDDAVDIADLTTGGTLSTVLNAGEAGVQYVMGAQPGVIGGRTDNVVMYDNATSNMPNLFRTIMGRSISRMNIAVGSQQIVDLIYNLVKEDDFAFKYNSHGFYDNFRGKSIDTLFRCKNLDSNYVGSSFQTFGDAAIQSYKINNLFRPSTVAVNTDKEFDNPQTQDRSRFVVGGGRTGGGAFGVGVSQGNAFMDRPERMQKSPISCLYGGLKFQFENQYGQIDSIKQIQMRDCVKFVKPQIPTETFESNQIFAGDVYVNRYTEKTIMPIFTDFLNGQPDQYTYNYLQRINIPYPRYWMNTRLFDTQELAGTIINFGIGSGGNALPNDLFYLDRPTGECGFSFGQIFNSGNSFNPIFNMRIGYMYTHCNGVQDFFVESEYNMAQRDWEDTQAKRHYDTYTYSNTDDLFHADIVKEDNFYKYDMSLSVSKFLTQISNFGEVQTRDYDPYVAEKCFSYYPKRLIYSLQAQKESKKDFWRVFLPNNYKDFKNPVNVIKPINKSGAIIFFPYQSPQMFQGLDTLKTDLGTKLTLGDGGLFSQPFQNVANSDLSNEYGSCESHRAVMNTPMGLFFLSQAQGKVFHYTGKLENIANQGMKWWFNKYLPSQLIRQFPELEETPLADNPVIGVGCQVIYDINDDVVYFCKKDYKAKEKWNIVFDKDDCQFYLVTDGGPVGTGPVGTGPIGTADPVKPSRTDVGSNIQFAQTQAQLSKTVGLGSTSYTPGPVTPNKTITNPTGPTNPVLDPILEPITDPILVPVPTDKYVPIDLGDPLYFEDASWTVSYDPKAKAWISFHDWHPELCLPSINHFLTTKTIESDEPYCPPGYTFNAVTGQCEITLQETAPAPVNVEEVGVTITGGLEQCLLDIVVAMDVSGSTNGARRTAQQAFLTGFLNDPVVFNGMQNGNIQVGFTRWSGMLNPPANNPISLSMNPNGFSMSNTIGEPAVTAWYNANWGGGGGGTMIQAGMVGGDGVRQQRATSELGDRSANPAYRSILLFITDSTAAAPANVGCPFQSPTLGGSGAAFEFVISLFAGLNQNAPNQAIMNNITCTAGPTSTSTNGFAGDQTQFGIDANVPNDIATASSIIAGLVCGTPPECDCPPGYTMVFPGANGYTEATGECDPDNPPICRKIECECPPPPFVGATTTEAGQCDDIYLVGSSSYTNPNPLICTFFFQQFTQASYERGSLWRHNYRCDLFANYYGEDYPWEVEFVENSGQIVNTVRNLEYQLESYVYKGDMFNGCGDDRWHDLDFNFDELIVHNTEQVSGLLRINQEPKNDPLARLNFPQINLNDIDVVASKIEQKYRINQFWDITNDRGEFTNAEQQIFFTQENGYIRDLNATNLNYNKDPLQHKKFRHYYNKFLLRRRMSNDRKMLLKLNNTKLNLSFR